MLGSICPTWRDRSTRHHTAGDQVKTILGFIKTLASVTYVTSGKGLHKSCAGQPTNLSIMKRQNANKRLSIYDLNYFNSTDKKYLKVIEKLNENFCHYSHPDPQVESSCCICVQGKSEERRQVSHLIW